jgi:hypothetical protein
VTFSLSLCVGESGLTLDVSTELTYPAKTERTRRTGGAGARAGKRCRAGAEEVPAASGALSGPRVRGPGVPDLPHARRGLHHPTEPRPGRAGLGGGRWQDPVPRGTLAGGLEPRRQQLEEDVRAAVPQEAAAEAAPQAEAARRGQAVPKVRLPGEKPAPTAVCTVVDPLLASSGHPSYREDPRKGRCDEDRIGNACPLRTQKKAIVPRTPRPLRQAAPPRSETLGLGRSPSP